MAASAQVVAQNLTDAGYDMTLMAPWPEPAEWTGRVDQELLGFRRDLHHKFLLGGFAGRAVRIERAGRAAGYAYISAQGQVGPLAIAPDLDAKGVVITALRCALESGPSQVPMVVPGRADVVMQAVLALGFRIGEPYCPDGVAAFRQLEQLSAARPGVYLAPPPQSSLARARSGVTCISAYMWSLDA
jgi:hypothetical protein